MVSFLRICAELLVLIEEPCRIMGTIYGKCGRNCQEEQGIYKGSLMISLCFEEISLNCRNVDIFHQFCGIMGSIFRYGRNYGSQI